MVRNIVGLGFDGFKKVLEMCFLTDDNFFFEHIHSILKDTRSDEVFFRLQIVTQNKLYQMYFDDPVAFKNSFSWLLIDDNDYKYKDEIISISLAEFEAYITGRASEFVKDKVYLLYNDGDIDAFIKKYDKGIKI